MKRFMQMFEVIMVAIAYAEEGVPLSFLRLKDHLSEEMEDPAWELI